MIKITNVVNGVDSYWEVEDTSSNTEKVKIPYDKNDPLDYNRIHELKRIVDSYESEGYTDVQWTEPGKVITLSKP